MSGRVFRVVMVAGWVVFSGCIVRGQGLEYVEAYNLLVRMVNERLQAAGRSAEFAGKDPAAGGEGARVTQDDLNRMRAAVLDLMATAYVRPGDFDLAREDRAGAFPCMRLEGAAPLFTKVPADYRDGGVALQSDDFTDVPPLWTHVQELYASLTGMTTTVRSGRWTADGRPNQRAAYRMYGVESWYGFPTVDWGSDIAVVEAQYYGAIIQEDREPAAYAMMALYPPMPFSPYPGLIQPMTVVVQARRVEASYILEGLFTGAVCRAEFYNRASVYGMAPDPGIGDGRWARWGEGVGAGAGICLSSRLGSCQEPPFWPPYPDMFTMGGTSSGYSVEDAAGVVFWSFRNPPLLGAVMLDEETDGLVAMGCECRECLPGSTMEWDQPGDTRATIVHFLGETTGTTNGGVRLRHYIREFQVQGAEFQRVSLDTCVTNHVVNGGEGWGFVTIARPSGADVTFSLCGVKGGEPVGVSRKYRARTSGGEILVDFPNRVTHRFRSGQLVEVRAVTADGGMVAIAGNAGQWPGLDTYRDAGGHILSNVWAGGFSVPEYHGALVEAVSHYGVCGDYLGKVEVHKGSRILRRMDAGGTVAEESRLARDVDSGSGEIWEGISGGDTPTVARKTRRWEEVDQASGLITLVEEVVYKPGAPSAMTNRTEVRMQDFPWGREIVAEVEGAGSGMERESVRQYYTNAVEDGSNYGRLALACDADGGWQRYTYDHAGRVVRRISPLKNVPASAEDDACRVECLWYAGDAALAGQGFPVQLDAAAPLDDRPRLVVEMENGIEVGRSWTACLPDRMIHKRSASAGARYDAPDNLVSETVVETNGPFRGRPIWSRGEDGALVVTDYAVQEGTGYLVVTEERGSGEDYPTNGVRTITVQDRRGRILEQWQEDMDTGVRIGHQLHVLDAAGRTILVSNLVAGVGARTAYGCCGPESEVDQDGIETTRVYDELKQVSVIHRLGVTTFQTYDVHGQVVETRRQAGSGGIEETALYDSVGRLVRQVNPRGGITRYEYATNACGERVVTTIQPDGATVVEVSYLDGRTRCVTGSAVHAVSYDYGVDDKGRYTVEYRGADTNSGMWVKTWRDMLGRECRVEHADGHVVETRYDTRGRVVAVTDGYVAQLTGYNGKGEAFRSAVDVDRDGVIGADGVDRITEVETGYGSIEARDARWTRTYAYARQGSDERSLVGEAWQSVDGLLTWSIQAGRTNRMEVSRDPVRSTRREVLTSADGGQVISEYTNGLLREVRRLAAGGAEVARTCHEYDDWGRATAVRSRGPAGEWIRREMDYDVAGNVILERTEAGGDVKSMRFTYDEMGRRTHVLLADGGEVRYGYRPTGEVESQAGAQTTPVRYGYDGQGRLNALATFRDEAGGQPDWTRWDYDSRRGWVTGKVYADGTTNRYEYRGDGRLVKRISARGIETGYEYDNGGVLTNKTYSDGTEPVGYGMDRMGRAVAIVDGAGVRTFTYDADFRLVEEVLPGAVRLGYGYDAFGRRTNLVVGAADGREYRVRYGYDAAGRLVRVEGGGVVARYDYAADGRSVGGVRLGVGDVQVLGGEREYDDFGRLSRIGWQAGGSEVAAHAYGFDLLGKRVRCEVGDGTCWEYAYDEQGQLTEAGKFTADGKPVAGRQYKYGYDPAGNRRQVQSNQVVMAYAANALNQYDRYEGGVVGGGDVLGAWEGSVFRFGGVGGGGAARVVSKQVRECVHDKDGNLLEDGEWRYAWDAENRLRAASNATTVLRFGYDYMGRRVKKSVYSNLADAWELTGESVFAYDGWSLVNEEGFSGRGVGSRVRQYVWGLDLSGTLQGAGGVGGLLAMASSAGESGDADAGRGLWFYCYDGNGNVTALVGTNGEVCARYEYDPFGNTVGVDVHGPLAVAGNPFTFSTKYHDAETGLYDYGYRYYSPGSGRWISRDRVAEGGGYNLYGFCENNGISAVDPLGLFLIAFDGTGNNKDAEGDSPTNVRRLWEAYRAKSLYIRGVGSSDTPMWRVVENIGGGLSGAGGQARVDKAWEKVVEHYRNMSDKDIQEDPLDVIGFSRGAALARQFAQVVNRRGDPRKYRRINEWFSGRAMFTSRPNVEGCPLKIRFLGLFDTVPSFGKPGNHIDMGYNLSIPENVENVRHATSRDESRELFPLASIATTPTRVEKMFPGVHSDVGGGYADDATLEIQLGPLLWMWQEGKTLGVPWDMPYALQGWSPSGGAMKGHQSDVPPLKKFLHVIPYGLADHPVTEWLPMQAGDKALRPLWIP